jgi:hypothetical protein
MIRGAKTKENEEEARRKNKHFRVQALSLLAFQFVALLFSWRKATNKTKRKRPQCLQGQPKSSLVGRSQEKQPCSA